MALGLIPTKGRWIERQFDTTSTATFLAGCAVKISAGNTLSEYSGGEASLLGIAAISSASSLPAGKVQVFVPGNDHFCTADVPTGVAASSLSRGLTVGLYKVGNFMSFITTSYTSTLGRCAVITGELESTLSRIEIQFLSNNLVINSATSNAFV